MGIGNLGREIFWVFMLVKMLMSRVKIWGRGIIMVGIVVRMLMSRIGSFRREMCYLVFMVVGLWSYRNRSLGRVFG